MRSGKNSVSATLPTGVEITTSTGGIFDSTQIDINPTTVTGGLGSRQTSRGAVEFGISNVPLHFSKPIKIEISVPSYTKSTIPVLVKHGGSSTFTTTGLTNNPNATCTNGIASSPSSTANVVGGVATIYSCAASTFTAVEESSRSGGGSSSSSSSSSTSSSTTQNTTATGTTVVSSTGSTQETESSEETTDTENTETDTTDTENTQTTSEEEIQTSNETPVHFSEKYVQILKEKGAISTDIDTFIPEQNITRAEFLKILFNVHGIKYEDTNTERNDFSDITGDDWTSKIAYTALDTGISSGYADKTFKANAPITRIEAIKFILKISGVVIPETSTSDFTDVTEDWMKKYVNKAKDLEIISGQETELGLIFRPLDHLSRGEAAKMVVKTMGAGQ